MAELRESVRAGAEEAAELRAKLATVVPREQLTAAEQRIKVTLLLCPIWHSDSASPLQQHRLGCATLIGCRGTQTAIAERRLCMSSLCFFSRNLHRFASCLKNSAGTGCNALHQAVAYTNICKCSAQSKEFFRALYIVAILGKPAYATCNSRDLAVTGVKLPSAMTDVRTIVQKMHLVDSISLKCRSWRRWCSKHVGRASRQMIWYEASPPAPTGTS